MVNPLVVCYATDSNHPGVGRLLASCDKWGWHAPLVLDQPWPGWGGRLKLVLSQAERALQLGIGITHLVHVDAYDVVAVGPPNELKTALASYNNPPLLVATEAACWPPNVDASAYEPRLLPWWYAHSQWVLDLQQPRPAGFGDLPDDQDDQAHLHQLYLARTPGLVLDCRCKVVQSIAHSHPHENFFEVTDEGRVINRLTGSRPLFVHGNGQTAMDWVPGCAQKGE